MSMSLTTAGESHGPGLTCIVEGLPAGLEVDRSLLEGRLPATIFYNLLLSARRPD